MNYCLQYKNGATVTIFAPYDCGNKCPFCVNKKEYQADATFDIDEVLDSIKKMDAITPNCDFVITGGEPFADLKSLDKILSLISGINAVHNCIGNTGHKVFINTTLPIGKYQEMEIIDFINMHSKVITGLNVSRHIRNVYKEGELIRESTVAKFATVQTEGTRNVERNIEYYNLDVIISVGYRVKSQRGVQFRIWAMNIIKE